MNERLFSNFRCLAQCAASSMMIELIAWMFADAAQADTFSRVIFDNRQDELVITMRYRGTNPDHTFWPDGFELSPCRGHPSNGTPFILYTADSISCRVAALIAVDAKAREEP